MGVVMLDAFRHKDLINTREILKHIRDNGHVDINSVISILEKATRIPEKNRMISMVIDRTKVDIKSIPCPDCGKIGGLK